MLSQNVRASEYRSEINLPIDNYDIFWVNTLSYRVSVIAVIRWAYVLRAKMGVWRACNRYRFRICHFALTLAG